mmetsp:Transcript_13604/g.23315  ORF Transcript_13604/g.23315 Transcript_13604/m.23315 type:complete len:240 (-) Transcript_13604:277-996(-)
MPPMTPARLSNALRSPVAAMSRMGPGQSPRRPHPRPNMAAPVRRRQSSLVLVGKPYLGAKRGCLGFRRYGQATMLGRTPPMTTKAREGFHGPQNAMKPRTLLWAVMPAMPMPRPMRTPARRPTAKSNTLVESLRSSGATAKAARMAAKAVRIWTRRASDGRVVGTMEGPSSFGAPMMPSYPKINDRHVARFATATPTEQKTAVATRDLGERRDTPQIMWPLVHPLPSCVPTPTRTPERT